jgi:hypothetical protein
MSTVYEDAASRFDSFIDATSEPTDWPELIPFGSTAKLPDMNPATLPTWAGQFAAELATETETPPDLAVGLTLAACAIPAARRFRVLVKPNYFEPLNIWGLVALTPGNRKSAVQSATTKPLMEWQREQAEIMREKIRRIESEAQTMQARADVLRKEAAREKDYDKQRDLSDQVAKIEASIPAIPTLPLLWTSDATPERLGTLLGDNAERMAWLSSEGGLFDMLAGRYSGGIPNLDLMLKAHSGDSERVERGSRPPVDLLHPLLTIGISPQPSVLEGLAAKPGFRGRGLLGRFLYLVPESRLGYRTLNTQPMTDATRASYNQGIRAMLDTKPADGNNPHAMHLLRLSSEARAEWQDFAHHIERQFRPGASLELLTDWGGKAPGAAARIAGVLHCIEHAGLTDALEISTATMQRALEITAVFTAHSIHALGMMGNDEQMGAAKTVWEWMRRGRHWEITQREIFNALRGRFPKMDRLTPALDILAERGYIQIEEIERTGAGRPPSPKVIVRPDLREETR